jgi:transposase
MLKNPRKKAVKAAVANLTPAEQQWLEEVNRQVLAGGLNCGIGGSLLKLKPRNLDERLLREIIGERTAMTAQEVCVEFGISAAEFTEWQREGMPGDPSPTTPTEPKKITPTEFFPPNSRCCEVLRALRLTNFDPNALTILLGGQTVAKTQAEIAKAFGVSVQTIKVWSGAGMPKPSKPGDPYCLISILHWRSREDERADENQRRQF